MLICASSVACVAPSCASRACCWRRADGLGEARRGGGQAIWRLSRRPRRRRPQPGSPSAVSRLDRACGETRRPERFLGILSSHHVPCVFLHICRHTRCQLNAYAYIIFVVATCSCAVSGTHHAKTIQHLLTTHNRMLSEPDDAEHTVPGNSYMLVQAMRLHAFLRWCGRRCWRAEHRWCSCTSHSSSIRRMSRLGSCVTYVFVARSL